VIQLPEEIKFGRDKLPIGINNYTLPKKHLPVIIKEKIIAGWKRNYRIIELNQGEKQK